MKSWGSIPAVVFGVLAIGTRAQAGTLVDLGSLLSDQKNLTTFYGLIQVSGVVFVQETRVKEMLTYEYRSIHRFYCNCLHIKVSP